MSWLLNQIFWARNNYEAKSDFYQKAGYYLPLVG